MCDLYYAYLSKPMTTRYLPSSAHTTLAPLVPTGPFPSFTGTSLDRGL